MTAHIAAPPMRGTGAACNERSLGWSSGIAPFGRASSQRRNRKTTAPARTGIKTDTSETPPLQRLAILLLGVLFAVPGRRERQRFVAGYRRLPVESGPDAGAVDTEIAK